MSDSPRRYQHLDAIAEARRAEDIRRELHTIELAEAEAVSPGLNREYFGSPAHRERASQIAQAVAERREVVRRRQSLEGDALVSFYCADVLAAV